MTHRICRLAGTALLAAAMACRQAAPPPSSSSAWHLSSQSPVRPDAASLARIYKALDAASQSGTDPSISKFPVRAATVIARNGDDVAVMGGNTEYSLPEAVHGEVSVVNHVTARFGPEVSRRDVDFVAFYSQSCGDSRGCGDCRDYMRAATEWRSLLWVCGQASDRSVIVRRFADGIVEEEAFPDATAESIGLPKPDVERLLQSAVAAREGGITLFTPDEAHAGAAALTWTDRVYHAAAADDAAFHYRFPVGGVLQAAATERDYFVKAVLVAGAGGRWPRVTYRDRQYGYEVSSFGAARGRPATLLILSDGQGRFKATTFEAALPHAFSVARFNPGAIEQFLQRRAPAAAQAK